MEQTMQGSQVFRDSSCYTTPREMRACAYLCQVRVLAHLVCAFSQVERGHIVVDTLLPTKLFPRLPARATFVADTKNVSDSAILCPQQMFPSWRSLKVLANEDTLLQTHCCSWCFLARANWETFAADTKCFWTKSETFFVPDTKFVSAANVANAGKRGNICVGNNVSTFANSFTRVPLYTWCLITPFFLYFDSNDFFIYTKTKCYPTNETQSCYFLPWSFFFSFHYRWALLYLLVTELHPIWLTLITCRNGVPLRFLFSSFFAENCFGVHVTSHWRRTLQTSGEFPSFLVWQDIPAYLPDAIESIQRRALRIIFHNSSYQQALDLTNLASLANRRILLCKKVLADMRDKSPKVTTRTVPYWLRSGSIIDSLAAV